MKKREIRKFLINFLRENIRGYVIADLLRQYLEEYKVEYKKRHNIDLSPELTSFFLHATKEKASQETDEIIEECVDEFIAEKFALLPFKNLTITGLLIIPAITMLIFYGLRHFSYLMGKENAFVDLGFESLVTTSLSFCGLVVILISSCIDELRKQ